MVATPRTINYLITSDFQNGQSNAVSAQRLQDLTGTLQVRTPTYRVKDPEYGAFGDGSSHPASTVYGSLSALQAVYGTTISGVTVALTQELDWLATQLAINTAQTAGGGRVFFAGHGPYVFTNSNSVSDGSGLLLLGVTATAASANGPSVDLEGEEFLATILSWPTDTGSGTGALSCGPVGATYTSATGRYGVNFYEGHIRNLTFKGPGGTITPGTSPASMDGLVLGPRRHCTDVISTGFHSAINYVGDYVDFTRTYGINSYYGFYSADSSVSSYGGVRFKSCFFTQNAMAGIGISKNGSLIVAAYDCYLGNQPYGILFESGTPASYGQPSPASALSSSKFINCSFEAITNQFILDDNATVSGGGNTGTRSRGIVDVTFETTYGGLLGTRLTTGGRGAYAYIDVSFMFNVQFLQTVGGSFLAGATGLLSAFLADTIGTANGGGVIFEGAMDIILPTYTTAGIPFVLCTNPTYGNFGAFGNGSQRYFRVKMPGQWAGHAEYLLDTAAVPIYAVMERADYNGVKLGGTAASGTAMAVGFNRQTWVSGSNGKLTLVATASPLTVANVTVAQTNSTLVKMASGGHVVVASSLTDGVVVGWCPNNNGGSTSLVYVIPGFLGMEGMG